MASLRFTSPVFTIRRLGGKNGEPYYSPKAILCDFRYLSGRC